MDSPLPIIVVWTILAIVMVAYVAYRLMSDRWSGSKRHPLFPFTSNSSDGFFPDKGDYLGWVAYLVILMGLLGFVGIIYIVATNQTAPIYLINFAGISIMVGVGVLGVAKLLRKGSE